MPKDLRKFVEQLRSNHPDELVVVDSPDVDPPNYDVTAILRHLELQGRFPAVLFSKPKNLLGQTAPMELVSNLFATREKCAISLDLPPEECKMGLVLRYAERVSQTIAPQVVSGADAPVKEIRRAGDEADLRQLPIVRHHEMDPAPYIDMIICFKDPDGDFYNTAHQRTMYKGPRKLGLYMVQRHNWEICRKYEQRGQRAPVVIIAGHHPAFSLGAINDQPFGVDDYARIGGFMGESVRLVPSETWGDKFLVPADAEIVIEGEVLPNVREPEAPFGEWTGYYGPQRLGWVIEVTAITRKQNALHEDIFVGHRDGWIINGIPKEGQVYYAVKGAVPTVKAVHFGLSGNCVANCFISIDKKAEGDAKIAGLTALANIFNCKQVVVVDADVDPFNEEEVWRAVALRTQADRNWDLIRDVKGSPLDPSILKGHTTTKVIIDATVPQDRPYPAQMLVPSNALERVRSLNLIP